MHFHLFAIFERISLIFAIPVQLTCALRSCSCIWDWDCECSFLLCTLHVLFFFPLTSQCWRWVALDLTLDHCNGLASVTVLKPRIVLASSGDEFCNASTCSFAFNPGRIKVLQFPRWSFCRRFSHKATAVSLHCFQMRLADGIQLPDC